MDSQNPPDMWYRRAVWAVFALFVVMNSLWISSAPGLMGDEGSEGENVYELLTREGITVTGERSYIGPLIDYLRVPFILLFGYTTLAIRLPMLFFSFATFWLAEYVLRTLFGRWAGLYGLVALTFTPIYILYQRLGWTITLFPFFAFLILNILLRNWKRKWLWAGLAGGLGLANHIIFLATLAAAGLVGLGVFVKDALDQREEGVKFQLKFFGVSFVEAAVGF
ncbi:MAG: glycosyltransferase family 39 protein [Candidatus Andersenbacteria bacterium]